MFQSKNDLIDFVEDLLGSNGSRLLAQRLIAYFDLDTDTTKEQIRALDFDEFYAAQENGK